MESGKRSKNFTEREKILLIEVAKEFVSIIDNKKTDAVTVERKKHAWTELTRKFNAESETGLRTEKQLHALYDTLKMKARRNMSDDKSEMYKTGDGNFSPKTTIIDEKVLALLTPQFKPLVNEFDSSAPYYNNSDIETSSDVDVIIKDRRTEAGKDFLLLLEEKESLSHELQSSEQIKSSKRPNSPLIQEHESTPKLKKVCLTEIKRNNINNLSASIIKRKNKKQINEDAITAKKLEILELQKEQEQIKLEKTRTLLDIDIELKRILLENAKIDLELRKRNFKL